MGFFNKIKDSLKSDDGKNKNFRYLDNLIHRGSNEIILDTDIILDKREDEKYQSGIKIDVDNLILDGKGHTIDACGKVRIFYCSAKNITIKNITLKNGFSKKGGAIYNTGELNIEKSTLLENTVNEYGGAICNEGELNIEESKINENNASWGGAIYNNGQLNIQNSIISKNTANLDGGAIQNDVETHIRKTTINENTANNNGGAITNWYGAFTIIKSQIEKNSASVGGAVHNNKLGELVIRESSLNENSSQDDGGAIYNKEGNFKIFNCHFSNNTSPKDIIHNKDSLLLENTNFYENYSKCTIVNFSNDISNLSIFYGEFIGNNCEKSTISNFGKFCSIEKTIFENNLSQNNSLHIMNFTDLTLTSPDINDEKQSILNNGYVLLKSCSTDFKDKIYGNGTVETDVEIIPDTETFDFGYLDKKIHENNEREIILDKNIQFENYEKDFYEGGIELDIDDLFIDGNGMTIDGRDKTRFFIVTGKNITLKNITFKNGRSHNNYNNQFNSNGGAIKINHNAELTLENCKFINNSSDEYGGVIHNCSELNIINSIIKNSTANTDGGAITNWEGKLTIRESTLNENTTKWYGGAIDNRNGQLTISNSTLKHNNARDGGGIAHNGGETIINESILEENTANRNGGALYQMWGNVIVIESKLNKNTVRGYGGAIYKRRSGKIELIESILSENSANRDAGAIYTENQYFKSENCAFTNNSPNNFNDN